ncbi:hypothetical protein NDA16_003326 [Ustilago loliicola]|nr:hypothetical protein NDA16_003326 [Ustilago loliicola]
MNANETDRRTRSGGRGIRPHVDRAPTRTKRGAAKSKNKESDPEGPDDEAKSELYRQLCIISYQLQAHLDMVPHQSLDELRARFATLPLDQDDGENGKLHPTGAASAVPGASFNASRATTPAPNANIHNSYDQHNAAHASTSMYAQQPVIVKAEPPQSPRFSHLEPQHSQSHSHVESQEPSKPVYSPESSPEVALAQTLRPPPSSYNHEAQHYSAPAYNQYGNGYQFRKSPEPYPWSAKVDESQDEPMSPPFRPARSNIMSISALMDGPSRPSKPGTPSPELIRTPRSIEQLPPPFMQEWTEEDEMASQFLSACAAAIPKLDTTELDRLTQIAQLAAFDLPLPSAPSSPRTSTPPRQEQDELARLEAIIKYDPRHLNPLDTLDTAVLYSYEEAEYLSEMESNEELYETIRYLSSFDEVVDEWRAGELMRLRLQLEMRKAEIDRIWTCDRKLAWSTFVDDRAGELYRKAMVEASHKRWRAEMELDLLAVHRRKTKGLEKLTKDIFVPDLVGFEEDEEVKELYRRFGKFVAVGAKYTDVEDPLVRADLRKIRDALREHKRRSKQEKEAEADGKETTTERAADEEVVEAIADADVPQAADAEEAESDASSFESDSEDYDSDSSYVSSSSGISSLPSFSSLCSSPRLGSIADAEAPDILVSTDDLEGLASEVASQLGVADETVSDEDADESLWARQIRLANQLAAESALQSGVQTPAPASAMLSRATTPAPTATAAAAAKKGRGTKRKKRPPPPGARLWKKGRVQRDPTEEGGEEMQSAPQEPKTQGYQNGAGRSKQESRQPTPKPELEEQSRSGIFEPHAYGAEQQQFAAPSYSYPMRNQYEQGIRYDQDPYYPAEDARASYGGQYAYPPAPPAGAYTRPEAMAYGNNGDSVAHYGGRTPPPPPSQEYYRSYAQPYPHPQQQEYEQQQQQQQQQQLEQGLEQGRYPPHHHLQQPPHTQSSRSQWPY